MLWSVYLHSESAMLSLNDKCKEINAYILYRQHFIVLCFQKMLPLQMSQKFLNNILSFDKFRSRLTNSFSFIFLLPVLQNKKIEVGVFYSGITFIPSFMKIY